MRALSALTRAVEAALVVFVFSVVFVVFVILFVWFSLNRVTATSSDALRSMRRWPLTAGVTYLLD
jgi:hypothetical protein